MTATTIDRFPDAPPQIKALPVNDRGYPCPWFIAWVDGKPEFRAIGPGKLEVAVNHHRCWICGERMGSIMVFTLGAMCVVNKVAPEPPGHLECARFAAKACPFLSQPLAKRREAGMDALGATPPPGQGLKRNPGVVALWSTYRYRTFPVDDGVLFDIGTACRPVEWYAQGREATRAEVERSITTGLPALREMADADPRPGAHEALNKCVQRTFKHLPAPPRDGLYDQAAGQAAYEMAKAGATRLGDAEEAF